MAARKNKVFKPQAPPLTPAEAKQKADEDRNTRLACMRLASEIRTVNNLRGSNFLDLAEEYFQYATHGTIPSKD